MAASPIFFSLAEAQTTSTRSVTGGGGAFSTLICPDGTERDRPSLSFKADQTITTVPGDDDDEESDDDDNGGTTETQTTGSFIIGFSTGEPGFIPLFKEGTITDGTISTTSFVLTGTETSDQICGALVPTAITISGPCGMV